MPMSRPAPPRRAGSPRAQIGHRPGPPRPDGRHHPNRRCRVVGAACHWRAPLARRLRDRSRARMEPLPRHPLHGLRFALGGLVGRSRRTHGAASPSEEAPDPAEDGHGEHDPRPEEAVEQQPNQRAEHGRQRASGCLARAPPNRPAPSTTTSQCWCAAALPGTSRTKGRRATGPTSGRCGGQCQ